jgi:hypothetical protein
MSSFGGQCRYSFAVGAVGTEEPLRASIMVKRISEWERESVRQALFFVRLKALRGNADQLNFTGRQLERRERAIALYANGRQQVPRRRAITYPA